jgi:hypothetical protein
MLYYLSQGESNFLKNLRSLWSPTLGVSSPQLVSSEFSPTLDYANSVSDHYKKSRKIAQSHQLFLRRKSLCAGLSIKAC